MDDLSAKLIPMLPKLKQPTNNVLLGMYLSPIYLTYHIFAASLMLLSRQDNHVYIETTVAYENFGFDFSFS